MGIRCNSGRSLIDDHRLERLLQAICRHPWARFGLLQLESGLTEYQARAARKQALEEGMIETLRVATKGQPRPPRRYGLTPVGAYQARIPIPPINRRAEQLLAAGHLETVRTGILGGAPVRRRLVWAISPWRAAPNLTLDALTCVRGRGGVPVLIAFAAAPSTANPAWWYVELRRCWIRFRNARRDMEVGLAIVGAPFEARGLPTLAGPRPGRRGGRRQRPSPVYILRTLEYGSAINSPEKWERVPSSGSASCCPWDDPTFAPCTVPAGSFLDGRIPSSPRRQPLSAWAETSTHPAAPGLRASLSMTHAQAALVPALLRYPAFASAELAGLLEIRKRTVIRGLRQLSRLDLCECLPLFKREQRFVLTDRGIDLLAYQSMQTPSRFRSRRAWPSAHEPFTAFPRHMRYILAFMFALQRQGRLLEWDLVHARFAYTVAAAPADLVRQRGIELVPEFVGGSLSGQAAHALLARDRPRNPDREEARAPAREVCAGPVRRCGVGANPAASVCRRRGGRSACPARRSPVGGAGIALPARPGSGDPDHDVGASGRRRRNRPTSAAEGGLAASFPLAGVRQTRDTGGPYDGML